MNKKEKLLERNAQLAGNMKALAATAEAESRNLNPEEQTQFDSYDDEFRANEAEMARLDRLEAVSASLSQPLPRVIQPTDSVAPPPRPGGTTSTSPITGAVVAHNYANHGFAKGKGEFLVAVLNAQIAKRTDPRLLPVNAATTWASEGVGAEAGFLLPPQFSGELMQAVIPGDSFLSALSPVQTNSNLLVVPVNEKAYWQNSAGITSAATAEGGSITASKPSLGERRIPLYKFASLVHVSEETLADIPFMSTFVMGEMGNHLRYQLEDAVMNGTGEGTILGILNSPAIISLTDADSTATAIGAVDVLNMVANLLAGGSSFFVSNPTVMPAIQSMKTGTAGYPLMMPDMAQPERQALLGRPYYFSEACPILNTTGDIALVQPRGYVLATKSGGVQTSTTFAFAFDEDKQSFKATLRAGGAPLLSAKVARAKSTGSTYASHFVVITGSRS